MIARPCIDCGEVIPSGSRCDECKPQRPARDRVRAKDHPHANPARWKRISTTARRRQPWCLDCGTSRDLTTDHVIPVVERPDLAYEVLNVAVRCRPCNGRKGDTCTAAERIAVLAAIAVRKARAARFYAAETRGVAPTSQPVRPSVKPQGALHTAGDGRC